jgi:hypothetical protein
MRTFTTRVAPLTALLFLLAGWATTHAQTVELKSNTPVSVKTTQSLSSENLQSGQQVTDLVVAADVRVDGETVIASGEQVIGKVTSVDDRGAVGQAGKITIDLESTTAVDGTNVPLSGSFSREGDSKMGLSIGVSVLLCPLALLIKGDEGTVPNGASTRALTVGGHDVDVSGTASN